PVIEPGDLASVAISPDGQKIVFLAPVDGVPHLWLRQLDSVESRPLPGTAWSSMPFWSPDNRAVGFFAEGRLKRIDLAGGLVRTLTEAVVGLGGAWNQDGVILFAENPASAITRISADGERRAAVTRLEPGQSGHNFPHFLPDGRHFFFSITGAPEIRGVYLGQLDGAAPRKLLIAESSAVYASGHVLFVRDATLIAQPFDSSTYELSGNPFPVATGVMGSMLTGVYSVLSASTTGTIAFRVGSAQFARELVWMDRSGKPIGTVGNRDPGFYASPSASPDGASLALLRRVAGNSDVWLLETKRGVLSRFTDHPAEDIFPLWARDGSRIVFSSNRNGTHDLFQKPVSGAGSEELLLPGDLRETFASDWSPDNQFLLFQRRSDQTGFDLWAMPLRGNGQPFAVSQTEFHERDGQFSPDGKWIAFYSNRSGQFEVYVQPFPGPGPAVRVSTGGGAQQRWRPDGRELFYIALDGRFMAASLTATANNQLDVGIPVPLFAAHVGHVLNAIGAQYIVSNDGQRWLMNTLVQGNNPTPIRLILNWHPRPPG
ncbi:MAG: hypothetical protein ACREMQ_09560, partial [Longimicrobiales bacterium]